MSKYCQLHGIDGEGRNPTWRLKIVEKSNFAGTTMGTCQLFCVQRYARLTVDVVLTNLQSTVTPVQQKFQLQTKKEQNINVQSVIVFMLK